MKIKKLTALFTAAAVSAACISGLSVVVSAEETINIDFTTMTEVPVYSAETGQGFTDHSDAIMPEAYKREVAPVSAVTVSSEGAKVTESTGTYLNYTNSNQYNYGGLVYRVDTGRAGAYHLEVEVTGTSSDTRVAPTGMDSSRLTSTSNWDNAGEVPRTVSAKWSGSTWSYDFATGESFIELEIEPSSLPSASAPKTVGVKSIKITPLAVNEAGDKPTIHILGDSTQKTYTFNETISSWGQTLGNYFDKSKVNVINYSMGGRAMKSNYNEGRFDEILITGKEGDFVFIHSAHNDETVSNDRFERGSATSSVLADNNANYNRWLDMYVEAIKARGMTPVLVTSMPRINSVTGKYSESDNKPNGFNPDAPGNMRAKAAADDGVGLIELYYGAKAYINSLDPKEVSYIYNSVEAGETPAANSANGANGDGTHYRESAAKQFCRIILQSIYEQAETTGGDAYTDQPIMAELESYMPQTVIDAAMSGDWSEVFPEMASDVSAVDVVPYATAQAESNFYYRTSIEKALQLGLLHKDTENNFKPTQTITVGEFARGIEKAFGLAENSLTSYTKTYAELNGSAPEEPTATAEVPTATAEVPTATAEVPTPTIPVEEDTCLRIEAHYNTDRTLKSITTSLVFVSQAGAGTDDPYTKVFYWDNLNGMKPVTAFTADNAAAMGTAADEYTVTVTQPEGGTVTVYNESAYKTETADIPAGITAGQVIADNDYFTFTAPSEIASGTDKTGVFADNSGISINYAEFRNIGTKEFVYTAKADGTLTVYGRTGGNKKVELTAEDGSVQASYMNDALEASSESNVYGTVHFNVTAGTTYTLYTRGGTGRLFGIMYSSNDYPQSTESLVVNAGDTVRITALAAENYVNNSILVNGVAVSSGKETAITINADTTVTATFTSEPALVENTVIASDAALTREAMGAILYDAYNAITDSAIKTNIGKYMAQNGGVPTPDDPNYDPNIKYEGSPYIPITGWGALTDKEGLSDELYAKVKAAYNLGLIRPETGIARGSIALGTELEPTAEVTRAKAAKSLVFCFILTQPTGDASQKIPEGFAPAEPSAIAAPNAEAPRTVFTK